MNVYIARSTETKPVMLMPTGVTVGSDSQKRKAVQNVMNSG